MTVILGDGFTTLMLEWLLIKSDLEHTLLLQLLQLQFNKSFQKFEVYLVGIKFVDHPASIMVSRQTNQVRDRTCVNVNVIIIVILLGVY